MSELLQLGNRNARPKAPRPDELKLQFSANAIRELFHLQGHYPDKKSCILPGLWIAQREYGGTLTGNAIAEVAYRLDRSYAEVEGVATFYSMYNTKHAVGRHMIEVCTCLSCQVCGAYPIAEYLKQKLGVNFGETTEDGITLHEVECLNACDRAPLLQVGDRYIGPVTEADIDTLLEELRQNPASTVTQMADQIVQVHLPDFERIDHSKLKGVHRTTESAPKKASTRVKAEATVQPSPSASKPKPDSDPEPDPKPKKARSRRIIVDDSA